MLVLAKFSPMQFRVPSLKGSIDLLAVERPVWVAKGHDASRDVLFLDGLLSLLLLVNHLSGLKSVGCEERAKGM